MKMSVEKLEPEAVCLMKEGIYLFFYINFFNSYGTYDIFIK